MEESEAAEVAQTPLEVRAWRSGVGGQIGSKGRLRQTASVEGGRADPMAMTALAFNPETVMAGDVPRLLLDSP